LDVKETISAHELDGKVTATPVQPLDNPSELEWKYEHFASAFVLYMVLLVTILAPGLFLTGNSAFYFFDTVRAPEATANTAKASF